MVNCVVVYISKLWTRVYIYITDIPKYLYIYIYTYVLNELACWPLGQWDIPISEWIQWDKLMGPTWGPPGSCRPQMGPILAPWTLLSGSVRPALNPVKFLVPGCYIYLPTDMHTYTHVYIQVFISKWIGWKNAFQIHFCERKFCILIKFSLKFVPKGPIDSNAALV